jgi:hypothetical protein
LKQNDRDRKGDDIERDYADKISSLLKGKFSIFKTDELI